MAPPVLAIDGRNSPDRYNCNPCSGFQPLKSFASVTMEEGKPFDFLRIFCEGVIAGGTAGVVVESALYPIDTIKTRLQAAHGGGKIVWKGLYSGLAGNLAGVLPASALFVGVYEPVKQKLLKIFPENLSAFAHLTAGAIGGAASSLIRVPTEVVKQRMQTGQFTSAPEAVRLIVAREGFGGLYAGYRSFLLRDLPFDAIQFCIYEQLRIGYKLAARRDLTDPENAVIGAFAGAITGAVTTPLDVIKTRLMIQGSANQYRGIVDCVQTVVREEGPSALLKEMIGFYHLSASGGLLAGITFSLVSIHIGCGTVSLLSSSPDAFKENSSTRSFLNVLVWRYLTEIFMLAGYWTEGVVDRHRWFYFLQCPREDKTLAFPTASSKSCF